MDQSKHPYYLSCVPTLQYKNIHDTTQIEKINEYIKNKISEINTYERKTYDEIFDHIQYDYYYYFKMIIDYDTYYNLMNMLTHFDPDNINKVKIPNNFNCTRLEKINNTSKEINILLDDLEIFRNSRINHIQEFAEKNKIYIRCRS
jgi:hypothetical protein